MKYPSQFKNATKNKTIFNFVLCQVRLILYNTNLNIKKQYSIRENRSKDALNHRKIFEIAIQM